MRVDRRHLRRALFIGVNLCSALAVYGVAIQPVIGLFSDQADRLTQARAALARYRAVASHEAAAQEAAARAGAGPYAAVFLPGTSEGAISAGLQAGLKAIADRASAHVQSVRAIEPRVENGIRHVGAHLELTGPIGAIKAALDAIEGSVPYLFIDAVSMRMPAAPPGIIVMQEPAIEAQIDVYGPVQHHVAAH
jgi:Type II secretion system (T2SS), protein M subtype b